ncbi:hypothetical protein [Cryptosporangium sp. NPDC051539]|uniref:hypothetical protein n=1 Tax=Cryptosporangium sp. NPDC051539 TaxID=3363962 RepID=UPI0037A23E00
MLILVVIHQCKGSVPEMSEKNSFGAAAEDLLLRRYHELGNAPPVIDIVENDCEYGDLGAHTMDRHGPGIPLRRAAGVKTIEGRIYGDWPWRRKVNRSYQWTDVRTIDREVNAQLRRNWETIRIDLAARHFAESIFDVGRRVGRGYYNGGMYEASARRACYAETDLFLVRLRLAPDSAVPFVLSTFPWS